MQSLEVTIKLKSNHCKAASPTKCLRMMSIDDSVNSWKQKLKNLQDRLKVLEEQRDRRQQRQLEKSPISETPPNDVSVFDSYLNDMEDWLQKVRSESNARKRLRKIEKDSLLTELKSTISSIKEECDNSMEQIRPQKQSKNDLSALEKEIFSTEELQDLSNSKVYELITPETRDLIDDLIDVSSSKKEKNIFPHLESDYARENSIIQSLLSKHKRKEEKAKRKKYKMNRRSREMKDSPLRKLSPEFLNLKPSSPPWGNIATCIAERPEENKTRSVAVQVEPELIAPKKEQEEEDRMKETIMAEDSSDEKTPVKRNEISKLSAMDVEEIKNEIKKMEEEVKYYQEAIREQIHSKPVDFIEPSPPSPSSRRITSSSSRSIQPNRDDTLTPWGHHYEEIHKPEDSNLPPPSPEDTQYNYLNRRPSSVHAKYSDMYMNRLQQESRMRAFESSETGRKKSRPKSRKRTKTPLRRKR